MVKEKDREKEIKGERTGGKIEIESKLFRD